jgi:hypothetical protein
LKIPKTLSKVNQIWTDNNITIRKRTNNILQNTTLKTEDRATQTPLKPGVEQLRCPDGVSSFPASICGTRHATFKQHEYDNIETKHTSTLSININKKFQIQELLTVREQKQNKTRIAHHSRARRLTPFFVSPC